MCPHLSQDRLLPRHCPVTRVALPSICSIQSYRHHSAKQRPRSLLGVPSTLQEMFGLVSFTSSEGPNTILLVAPFLCRKVMLPGAAFPGKGLGEPAALGHPCGAPAGGPTLCWASGGLGEVLVMLSRCWGLGWGRNLARCPWWGVTLVL